MAGNVLYPPSIASFMPAFIYDTDPIVWFSLSSFNNVNDVKNVHVSVRDQRTNENVLVFPGTNRKIPYLVWNMERHLTDSGQGFISNPTSICNSVTDKNVYGVRIPRACLNSSFSYNQSSEDSDEVENVKCFNINQYYKVQIRFDGKGWEDPDIAATLLEPVIPDTDDNNNDNGIGSDDDYIKAINAYNAVGVVERIFSEWSQVCLIRAIREPQFKLTTKDGDWRGFKTLSEANSLGTAKTFAIGEMPISGTMYYELKEDESEIAEHERIGSYSIEILDEEGNSYDGVSLGLEHVGDNRSEVEINDTLNLLNLGIDFQESGDKKFILKINIVTTNNYIFDNYFVFKVSNFAQNPPISSTEITTNEEYGYVDIAVKGTFTNMDNQNISDGTMFDGGYLYIRRASSKDKFKKWELLGIFEVKLQDNAENQTDWTVEITDTTVESLQWYKYSFQTKTSKGALSATWFNTCKEESSGLQDETFFLDFYDTLFVRDGRILPIRYDFSISSYSRVVNRTKIDTLGGKYPKFAENAMMNYKHFSISGKISSQADENLMFMKRYDQDDEQNSYMDRLTFNDYYAVKETHEISSEDMSHNNIERKGCYTKWGNWLSYNDWYWEREFREEVFSWLNDGEPKLMKTMTEGNVVVMLTDISLTPEKVLGRRLYNFTANAYEVSESTDIETLNRLGIFKVVKDDALTYEQMKAAMDSDTYESSGAFKYTIGQMKNWSYATMFKDNIDGDTANYNILNYIKAKLSREFSGRRSGSAIDPNSVYLTSVKVQFNKKPFRISESDDGILSIIGSTDKNTPTNYLGYYFNASTDGNKNNIKPFYVNPKGYYQFPDEIKITNLSFPDLKENNISVDISYILHYKVVSAKNTIASDHRLAEKIIGQERRVFNVGEKVSTYIYNKYFFRPSETSVRRLNYWQGFSLEFPPYTVLEIQYEDQETFSEIMVGMTGIFDMLSDCPTRDIKLKGRKMFPAKAENAHFLRENEYFVEGEKYKSINDIERPVHNCVYTISDNKKIYINNKWYDFDADEELAKIPLYGTINYRGSIEEEEF